MEDWFWTGVFLYISAIIWIPLVVSYFDDKRKK